MPQSNFFKHFFIPRSIKFAEFNFNDSHFYGWQSIGIMKNGMRDVVPGKEYYERLYAEV
jgi:hypothetical protein